MRRRALSIMLFLAVHTAVLGAAPAGAADVPNLSLVNSEGKVKITRGGKTFPPFYNENTPLERYDVIDTGADGLVEIIVRDEFGLRFYENTRLTVVSVLDSSVVLRMNEGGAVLVNALRMADNFKFTIETPHATAAIKKAQCWIGVSPDGPVDNALTFGVLRGELTVTVDSSGAAIGLPLDCAIDVTSETYVPPLRQVTTTEAEILRDVHTIPTQT